ncbi:Cell division protein FtsQ [bacterium HR39]|nr:Cell division protein FtsQ [bacterium HR39]
MGGATPPPGSDLPWLFGEDAPRAWPALQEALARHPELAPRVRAAVRVGGRRWNLLIDGRIEVRLPESDVADALGRLARLEAADRLLERAVVAVDLRHPGLVAVEPDLSVLAAAGGGRT